jgi:predicted O-methyltransferase YrrM
VITQATNDGTAGQFACPIVIPAQSQILHITLMVTTAWTGTTTLGVGTGASATAFTTAAAVSGATLGQVIVTPGTSATQSANWDNVGTQDVQIVVLSGSTGSGVGTLSVEYVPNINLAS